MLNQLVAIDAKPVALPGGEALAGRRQYAIELSEIRPFCKNATRHHVFLRYQGFDCHMQIGKLSEKPFCSATRMLWSINLAWF